MRWIVRLLAVMALALTSASAQSPKRVALVVANASYAGYAPLPNTTVDATLVAEALRRAGFSVIDVKTNQGIAGFRTALGAFQTRAQGAEVAAVYYAGHGIEVNGRNWLIPTDAALENDGQLAFQAIDADLLVQAAAGARTRIVVLDACRENPFAGRMRRTGRVTRDAAPGLGAPVGEGARGTLLMYSAAPGELAADGAAGQGSPFARAFARHLPEPGVELRVAAGKIADAVFDETRQAQLPFTSSSLSGAEIYLVAGARTVAPDPELERLRRENEVLRRSAPNASAPPASSPATMVRPSMPNTVGTPAVQGARLPFEPEMVRIPGGSFVMGSPAGEAGRQTNEGPQRTVSVRAFEAGRYEVTFAEWDACVADGGCGGYRPADQGWGRGRQPAINVSWNDAKAYVQWLSRRTGKSYRLLTEAEWEYAARAGTTGRFSNNGAETELCGIANHADQSTSYSWKNAACSDGVGERTAPVGRYNANGFGLHDMHGNVWEWVEDCYKDSYSGAPADGSAFVNQSCSYRVLRGGSWDIYPQNLRSANRSRFTPSLRGYVLGFRVARTL